MGKKVLVITGSPRRGGNSDMLADAFIEGAVEAGNEVMKFPAGLRKVNGCIACGTCWSKGHACSIEDDFMELEGMLETADILVLVSPLYWFGVSSQIKAAIDRFHAYSRKDRLRDLAIKESMLIMCGETDVMTDFAGAMATYDNMRTYKGWTDAGGMMVPCVRDIGDIAATGALEGARELGMSVGTVGDR